MDAAHPRQSKKVRLANPSSFMARERTIIKEAFAGDIIELYDPGIFRIGDTISTNEGRVSTHVRSFPISGSYLALRTR